MSVGCTGVLVAATVVLSSMRVEGTDILPVGWMMSELAGIPLLGVMGYGGWTGNGPSGVWVTVHGQSVIVRVVGCEGERREVRRGMNGQGRAVLQLTSGQ